MKEYLSTLKRQELIKLYTTFGVDSNIKSNILKQKNDTIQNLLFNEELLTKEVAIDFLAGKDNPAIKELLSLINGVVEYENQPEVTISDGENPNVTIQKALAKTANDLKVLAKQMEKDAMTKVVATINSVHKRDIESQKKCETIFFSNQYFSVAKVVPFGIKCVLPKCIVEIAQTTLAPVYVMYETQEQRHKNGRLGTYQMRPKYNVIVHGTLEEYEKSEAKKKELGI